MERTVFRSKNNEKTGRRERFQDKDARLLLFRKNDWPLRSILLVVFNILILSSDRSLVVEKCSVTMKWKVEAFSSLSHRRSIPYKSFRTTTNDNHYGLFSRKTQSMTIVQRQQSLVNDFVPKQMTLTESMVFFARYVFKLSKETTVKRELMGKRRTISKLWSAHASIEDFNTKDIEILKKEVEQEILEKKPLKDTMANLNNARKELIHLVGYDAKLLVPCFGFAIMAAFMNSIIPHYYSMCVNCLANALSTSRQDLIKAMTGLAVSSTLCALFTGLRGALFWLAGSRGNYNVRVKLHRNLLLQEASFFDSTETGVLLSRLNNDVNKIGMVISFHVNVVFRQFAQMIFGAVYLFKISRPLALAAFGGIGIVTILSAIYGEFSRILAERLQNTFAESTAVAETSFSMSETVRAFDGLESEVEKYESSQSRALDLEEVQAWAYGSHKFISDTLQTGLQGLLLFACWTMGRTQELPIEKLTTFMFYVNFVLESSSEVGDQWAKIQSAIGATSNVFELIRRVPAIRDPKLLENKDEMRKINGTERHVKGSTRPIIHIKNMSISYGSLDITALNHISLDIYEGDRIAIVGRSGSGKSSLLRTLLRFYDPTAGKCELLGKSLKEWTRRELASTVSVVEQEPHLFPMSLVENVLYGIPKDSINKDGEKIYSDTWRREVAVALDVAGLPVNGAQKNDLGLELDTRVGEGGRTLSGGQRQRVAIARALIRKPTVLLLDEPTAALDSESEKTVVKALSNAMKQTKSMLMVTHRLGVIRSLDVNKVVVLDRGEIAEVGHPEDLLRQGGIFSQLAREQGIVALVK